MAVTISVPETNIGAGSACGVVWVMYSRRQDSAFKVWDFSESVVLPSEIYKGATFVRWTHDGRDAYSVSLRLDSANHLLKIRPQGGGGRKGEVVDISLLQVYASSLLSPTYLLTLKWMISFLHAQLALIGNRPREQSRVKKTLDSWGEVSA